MILSENSYPYYVHFTITNIERKHILKISISELDLQFYLIKQHQKMTRMTAHTHTHVPTHAHRHNKTSVKEKQL